MNVKLDVLVFVGVALDFRPCMYTEEMLSQIAIVAKETSQSNLVEEVAKPGTFGDGTGDDGTGR